MICYLIKSMKFINLHKHICNSSVLHITYINNLAEFKNSQNSQNFILFYDYLALTNIDNSRFFMLICIHNFIKIFIKIKLHVFG